MPNTIRVPTAPRKVIKHMVIILGMTLSIPSISFENLLRMRPCGVVSKKLDGEWRMFASRSRWSLVEAFSEPIAMTIAATRTNNPRNKEASGTSMWLLLEVKLQCRDKGDGMSLLMLLSTEGLAAIILGG